MGRNELPTLALYWLSDEIFGNEGIKKVIPICTLMILVEETVGREKGHVFTKWHDKQDVSVMANIVSPLVDDVAVDRNQGEIPKPAVIDLYNKAMGGF